MSGRIFRKQAPVHFNGKIVFVKNVTKYTTCNDVIHMLILKSGIPLERISSYSLFEESGNYSKMLQRRTRILKSLRSWGCEKDYFKFVLKNVDDDQTCLLKNHGFEDNCSVSNPKTDVDIEDRDFLNSSFYSKTNISFVSANERETNNAVKQSWKSRESVKVTVENDKIMNEKSDKHTVARRRIKTENTRHSSTDNKAPVQKTHKRKIRLHKYLYDLIPIRPFKRSNRKESSSFKIIKEQNGQDSRPLDGNNIAAHKQFHNLQEMCRYYWTANSESDNDSEFEDEDDHIKDLNEAFLRSKNEDVNSKLLECSNPCLELNTGFISENNKKSGASILYACEDFNDSDISLSDISSCELERNITSCNVVRNVFCSNSSDDAVSEDDAMDSFMRTRIYDSESEDDVTSQESI